MDKYWCLNWSYMLKAFRLKCTNSYVQGAKSLLGWACLLQYLRCDTFARNTLTLNMTQHLGLKYTENSIYLPQVCPLSHCAS